MSKSFSTYVVSALPSRPRPRKVHEVLQAMVVDSGVSVPSLKVDGGMTANSLLMQFQADLLDVQVCERLLMSRCIFALFVFRCCKPMYVCVGGGAGAPRGQVLRPRMAETTALGAAFAAGLAVGVWQDAEDLERTWKKGEEYSSTMSTEDRREVGAVME